MMYTVWKTVECNLIAILVKMLRPVSIVYAMYIGFICLIQLYALFCGSMFQLVSLYVMQTHV